MLLRLPALLEKTKTLLFLICDIFYSRPDLVVKDFMFYTAVIYLFLLQNVIDSFCVFVYIWTDCPCPAAKSNILAQFISLW